jgi:PAS domain S-box-containing protein
MPQSSSSAPRASDFWDPLKSTTVASFASDESGCITVWNQAAEALLGHEARRVVGKRCFDVMRGRDLFGNRFCGESCAVRKMQRHGEPIHPYEFEVMNHDGKMIKVRCSVIVAPNVRPHRFNLIHLIEPLGLAPEIDVNESVRPYAAATYRPSALGERKAVSPDPIQRLTTREIEVLRLMAGGTSTNDIARALGIQASTVKNHIQHILEKLGAHTKLQAACVAQQRGLIQPLVHHVAD